MVLDLLYITPAPGLVLTEDPPPRSAWAPGPLPQTAIGYQRSARPSSAMMALMRPTLRAWLGGSGVNGW